jgi:hypothetical protein
VIPGRGSSRRSLPRADENPIPAISRDDARPGGEVQDFSLLLIFFWQRRLLLHSLLFHTVSFSVKTIVQRKFSH